VSISMAKLRRTSGLSKPIAILLTAISFTATASAQEAPRFEQRYDRFDDVTRLAVKLGQVIKGSHHNVELQLVQSYHGEGRNGESIFLQLYLFSASDDGWVYRDHHDVTLLVDGERVRFDPTHDGKVGKGYVMEHIFIPLSKAQLRKLASATKIEARIHRDEFELGRNQIAAIKEFAELSADPKRSLPESPSEAPAPKPKRKKR
jgi:hypothetical protein